MRITNFNFNTQNFPGTAPFLYKNILGLPLREKTPETFTVQAGTTRLTFRETTRETGYHFAFTIPSNKLARAKEWLATRIPLLTQIDQDEFFFESWNSGSLYFRDAANHILEFPSPTMTSTMRDLERSELLTCFTSAKLVWHSMMSRSR